MGLMHSLSISYALVIVNHTILLIYNLFISFHPYYKCMIIVGVHIIFCTDFAAATCDEFFLMQQPNENRGDAHN